MDTLIPGFVRSEREEKRSESTEVRIRKALMELGPTFVKLGQFLSTRADIVGVDVATELEKLQADNPASEFSVVKKIIESDLGNPIDELFDDFSPTALAAGSIGQVHKARLKTGQPVVVKVQHPGIHRVVKTDMEILGALAQLASQLDDFKNYQPVKLVSRWKKVLEAELDFSREKQRLSQFRQLMKKEKELAIPEPFPDFCSDRILTMEFLDGRSVKNVATENDNNFDLKEIAKNGASVYLKMIFRVGLYHADPHAGNILILSDGRIGLIDFGMVGRVSSTLRESIEEMLLAIVNQDVPMLMAVLRHVCTIPKSVDFSMLENDLADFVSQYAIQSMDQFNISNALNDIVRLIQNHQIQLPPEAALLIKTFVSLEGTGKILHPDFSLMEILGPMRRSMILNRLSPTRYIRRIRRMMMEVEHLVDRLPERLGSILKLIQDGEINVQINHHGLGSNINRLVLGMMTSALFLGSSVLLSMKVPPLLFPEEAWWGMQDLSLIGITGVLGSFFLGARLLWSIRKSGNLDEFN